MNPNNNSLVFEFDAVLDQLLVQYPDVINPQVTKDFISFPELPTQDQVEAWIVAQRRKQLEKRYLE
jgi:hypothetical protein